MLGLDYFLLIGALLIILSIVIARLSDNVGVPSLILFLAIGILAGSEGPGGIHFDDPDLARSVGIIALIFILFAGGLDTNWSDVRGVAWPAASLATLGVFLTASFVGFLISYALGFSLLTGLLIGSVISSTDAAAVFSVLRSKNVSLRGRVKPLLELESGSNDPMAVFLTVGLIEVYQSTDTTFLDLIPQFVLQMGLGALFGLGFGRVMILFLNRLKSYYEGLYPVFALAFACLVYASTSLVGGSGFLAVYVAGLVAGNGDFIQKKSLLRFFDGLAWLSQITMFLTLGLLVFPSRILPVAGVGVLVSLFLMFVARPLSVFVSLSVARLTWREKAFVSWVGLRGAVPIILATFPLLAKLPDAEFVFNVVFFIVSTSALLQGWSMPLAARILKVDSPLATKKNYPLEFAPPEGSDTELVDLIVPYHSDTVGRSIVELSMPHDSLIVLISRNEEFIVPSGGTTIEGGDTILVLVNKSSLPTVRTIFSKLREKPVED
jgi:cell volume regulation protein A